MFSGVSRHSGTRVTGAASTASTISSGGSSALTVIISVRWIITSRHRQVAQVEQAAEHVAVELLDAALAMQQIDRAAQFLVRRAGSAGPRRRAMPTQRAGSAHQRFDRGQHRPEQAHDPGHRPRRQQRDAVGMR